MSEADDYISRFAQHKVSIETLKTLTDDDLRRVSLTCVYLNHTSYSCV